MVEQLEARTYFAGFVFSSAVTSPAGESPQGIVSADFNGDGKRDVAVTNFLAGTVSILAGVGDGTFAAPVAFAAGANLSAINSADFNGDGKADLAVVGDDVAVFLGVGDGTFIGPTRLTVGTTPQSVTIADVDGDGKLDLVVPNVQSNNVSILHGKGDGTFNPAVNTPAGVSPVSVAVADFNDDGFSDLAVADLGDLSSAGLHVSTPAPSIIVDDGGGLTPTPTPIPTPAPTSTASNAGVTILLGQAGGTFAAQPTIAAGARPFSIAVGGLNQDTIVDLAVANGGIPSGPRGSDDASILLGNGDGTFRAATNLATGAVPQAVVVADLNGDGSDDVATANNEGANVSVFGSLDPAAGGGLPSAAANYATRAGSSGLTVGDFNGDGVRDIVTANTTDNSVSTLLGLPDRAVLVPEIVSGLQASALDGDKPKVSVRITNNGGATAKGIGELKLYASTDGVLDGLDQGITAKDIKFNLKPGQSKVFKETASLDLQNGTYKILGLVLLGAGVPDATIGPSVTISPAFVDLSPAFAHPTPATAKPGGKGKIAVILTNNGNSLATGTANIRLTLPTTQAVAPSDVEIKTFAVKVKLKPGTSKKYKLSFKYPADLAAGSYFFATTIDRSLANTAVFSDTPFTVTLPG